LHVPLQAGDDDVLKRMRRKYTTAEYAAKIARIRERWPEVSITTDLIVGFPGETQEMFENGLEFIQSMQFAEMHVFPYSKRTGTPAARMDDQIAEEVKNERVHQLIDCSETMQLNYAKQFVGHLLTMIPERESIDEQGERQLTGYTDNYLQVTVPSAHAAMGQPLAIQLLEAGVNECRGQLAQEISAGGVVFRKRGQGQLEIQLIKDRYGQMTLAKGKMEHGESIEQTALREVQEETGLEGVIVDSLSPVHYQYQHPNKGLINKIVHYYLIEASKTEPLVAQLEEIQDVDWYIPEVAWQMQLNHGYRNNDAIIQIALEKLGVGDGLQSVTNS
jgi:8-oxo-dGTP pyrophosphatase MutT (NUDIX family)